jgi:hypothetical protein
MIFIEWELHIFLSFELYSFNLHEVKFIQKINIVKNEKIISNKRRINQGKHWLKIHQRINHKILIVLLRKCILYLVSEVFKTFF